MSRKKVSLQDEILDDLALDENDGTVIGYSVVLDAINSDMETLDSFALKFSILMRIPVTKVKHMVSRLPNTMWTGRKRSKANMLLELIGEAGGAGRVVENFERPGEIDEKEKVKSPSDELCRKCGFPMKEDEEYCSFCMTSVKERKGKPVVSKPVIEKSPMIPTARFLFYFVILIAGVILAVVLR